MSKEMESIYDAHIADEKLKEGTKYERLAAVVFKLLTEENAVIHDLKLKGDGKSASHQIDVTIEKNGSKKRILIECKDYDAVVGIGIVRDFYGALAQIKPEDAIVITTKGFTRGAKSFANDEGIKLAILRKVIDKDLEDRIKTIVFRMHLLTLGTPKIKSWKAASDDDYDRFMTACTSDIGKTIGTNTETTFFFDNNENKIESFQSYLTPFFNSLERGGDRTIEGEHSFPSTRFIRIGDQFIGVIGFGYKVNCYEAVIESVLDAGQKVAVLLLKMLDGSLNKVFFEEDISQWTFDDSGEVVKK